MSHPVGLSYEDICSMKKERLKEGNTVSKNFSIDFQKGSPNWVHDIS
jgi:hypothetical protein